LRLILGIAEALDEQECKVDYIVDRRNLHFSANSFQQKRCIIIVLDRIYIFWFIKKTDFKVT